jgi:hypothetical protein
MSLPTACGQQIAMTRAVKFQSLFMIPEDLVQHVRKILRDHGNQPL